VDVDAFRPICLQNCALKVLTKVLTTRLQKEIPQLIDIHQTGFIKGRSITDTFIYALELVQVCHKRKRPAIALKLDFAKAFDTVNWEGLFNVLQARGFCERWCNWLHSLLTTSRSAVLVNGCPGPWISCKRGLRQGDPISPYLFLLVAETLQKLIRGSRDIKHPTDANLPPAVLQYADDTLIVFEATLTGASELKVLLELFANITGLNINYHKSTLVPIHVPEATVSALVDILGCRREGFPQNYLGLPLSVNKLPISAFTPLIHKADKYLSSWQASFLNSMGRAVLVNSVLDSILVYCMSSLQLPPWAISQMDKRRRGFLWSGSSNGRASPASCLVAWTNVCQPKENGGLGIRDLSAQNVCLLLKLLHRLHCTESSTWARWVQGRASIVTLTGDVHGDHWKTLRSLLPLYRALTSVIIGDGKSCSFWEDVWLGDDALEDAYPVLFSHCTLKTASVCQMMELGIEQSLVPRLSSQAVSELNSLRTALSSVTLSEAMDRRISNFSKGDSNLDSGAIYRMLKAREAAVDAKASFIWNNAAPPRVQLFMWLLLQGRVQSRSVLVKKCVVSDTTCEVCHQHEETAEHIIWGCNLGNTVWRTLGLSTVISTELKSLHTVTPAAIMPQQEFPTFLALVCWHIWKARNSYVFRSEVRSVEQVLLACKLDAQKWRSRLARRKRPIADIWCSIFDMARQGHG